MERGGYEDLNRGERYDYELYEEGGVKLRWCGRYSLVIV